MDTSDLTTEILKSIRDDIGGLREELHAGLHDVREELHELRDELRGELQGTNGRLDRLERRQVESEVRLSTELVTLVGVVREVRDAIRDDRVSRVRVDDHERRITTLEKRKP